MTLIQLRDAMRVRVLQALFVPVAAALTVLVLAGVLSGLSHGNPFAEGGLPHGAFEWLTDGRVAVALALAAWVGVLRWRPNLLRLTPATPVIATLGRLVAHGAGWGALVVVLTVAIAYLLHDPGRDPQGQFHIWVWASGLWHALVLAPALTLVSVWAGMRNKGHGSTSDNRRVP